MAASPSASSDGVFVRHSTRHVGFVFDEFDLESAWIREKAELHFPPLAELKELTIRGHLRRHPDAAGSRDKLPSLDVFLGNAKVGAIAPAQEGPWTFTCKVPFDLAERGFVLRLALKGVAVTNTLAWAGRVFENWRLAARLQRFRPQHRNRQLRIGSVSADGETVYDFSNRHSPYSPVFARKHARLGLNIVGFLSAELGVGESARCMIRAADAAFIPAAPIALKLPCKARQGDNSFTPFLQERNPHAVNVFHLDAPAVADIDHHHGREFRAGKYNVGYWAWELPEFPDAWVPYFDYMDEIWCPSEFVRAAIADKSPLPVITMPHAISFQRPVESKKQLRERFGLPADQFLFLFLYDLHSYSERKNPRGALNAFKLSGLAGSGAGIVIKVHGINGNETELEALRAEIAQIPGAILIDRSLSRSDLYALEAACDCFVSLHRSEGFGLAVAECMYLGKPVIATDWSATTEFLNETNGCPVRATLVTLQKTHGPYAKGQTWADPEVEHAADWMKKLHANPELAARLGAAAQKTIEQQFSPQVIGARYRRRLEAIASW